MADVRLDPTELALWNEAGSRGDAFRRATLCRASEQSRLAQRMVEVRDKARSVVRATATHGETDAEPALPHGETHALKRQREAGAAVPTRRARGSSRLALALALGGALACPGAAAADEPAATETPVVMRRGDYSARSHLYMGAGGAALVPLSQSGPHALLQSGGGFDVFFGVRLNRWVAVEFDWQPTFHGNSQDLFSVPVTTLGLIAASFDVKLHLARGAIEPYVVLGGGFDVLTESGGVLSTGPAFDAGVGIDFWVARTLSLGLKAQYRGASLSAYDRFGDDTYLSLLGIQAMLTGRFPDRP